jgi:O-antigen ligase
LNNIVALRKKIPLVNSYLLAAIFFMIPIRVAPAYILSCLMLFFWCLEGDLEVKWQRLSRHPLVWILFLYGLLPFVSLFWSQDITWGLHMAKRGDFYFLFPLYLSVVRKEHIKLYIALFLIAVGVSELLAYYNWFQINHFSELPQGIRRGTESWQIAPFVNHLMYNPILAFGAYLLGHAVLFEKMQPWRRGIYCFFMITVSINMMISGGRSGQAAFFVMMSLLMFQRFARRPVLAVLIALVVSGGIFIAAYQSSSVFQERVDLAVYEVKNYRQVVNSSVGLRINMFINTVRVYSESPILGVGVGDFPAEYARINSAYTPQWVPTTNPHNQYLFTLSTTGLIGGAVLLCMLFWPPYKSRTLHDEWSRIRIALPLLFSVICFGESYLWRSNTSLMFVAFTAILYADLLRPSTQICPDYAK